MVMNTDQREWISRRAVGRILGLSDKTIDRVAASNQLVYRDLPGLPRQYSRSGAIRLSEACTYDPSRQTNVA